MPDFGENALNWSETLSVQKQRVHVVVVRIRGLGEADAVALGGSFGGTWPLSPNTIQQNVCCLGPREWCILDVEPAVVAARMSQSIQAATFHVADLSAGCSLWRINGRRASDLLARGCSLDTSQPRFPPGRCARTLFARVAAVLLRRTGESGFELITDASLDQHMQSWFRAVGALCSDELHDAPAVRAAAATGAATQSVGA